MKVPSALTLAFAALAPVVSAGVVKAAVPSCDGDYSSTTSITNNIVKTSTITTTIHPTTVVTTTTTNTIISTKTIVTQLTATKTSTSLLTKFSPVMLTVSATITADPTTFTPDPVTSTVTSTDGFIPAASALPTANPVVKRAATVKGALCSVNVNKITSTAFTTSTLVSGATVSQTKTTSAIATSTKTAALAGTFYVTVSTTKIVVQPTTRTTTKTQTVVPTVTAVAEVDLIYAACAAVNLLDYAPSNATTASSKLRRGLASLFTRDTVNVGIDDVWVGTNMTTISENADNSIDCCVQCQTNPLCAGSYWDNDYETCSIVTTTTCLDQTATVGTFTYDDSNVLDVGAGIVVSNGACGQWSFGGEQDV